MIRDTFLFYYHMEGHAGSDPDDDDDRKPAAVGPRSPYEIDDDPDWVYNPAFLDIGVSADEEPSGPQRAETTPDAGYSTGRKRRADAAARSTKRPAKNPPGSAEQLSGSIFSRPFDLLDHGAQDDFSGDLGATEREEHDADVGIGMLADAAALDEASFLVAGQDVPASASAALVEPHVRLGPTDAEKARAQTPRARASLEKWYGKLADLVQFKKIYGHCDVPQDFAPNRALAHWVNKQRNEMKALEDGKKSQMTPEKIEVLNQLEFVWGNRKGEPSWNARYQELLEYKRVYGMDKDPPTKYRKNTALGRWVSAQRQQHREITDSNTTPTETLAKRWALLDKAHFNWQIIASGAERSTSARTANERNTAAGAKPAAARASMPGQGAHSSGDARTSGNIRQNEASEAGEGIPQHNLQTAIAANLAKLRGDTAGSADKDGESGEPRDNCEGWP